ncbi:MAG: hypothetical protein HQ517_05110, partial [SAR324 cluster bacterium]|nr:hypothetical protein [SAR324 cluster bacterium]
QALEGNLGGKLAALKNPGLLSWAARSNHLGDINVPAIEPSFTLYPIVSVNVDGKGGTVTKIGLDATAPYPKTKLFERVRFKEVSLNNYVIEE